MHREARGGPAAEGGPAGTGQAKTVAESVRLLPAGARQPRLVKWSRDPRDSGHRFNPAIDKRGLFRLGYIASYSQHSTGAALDLTLVDLAADNSATFDPAKVYADCTAPVEKRAPEGSIDMGTGYDCTDLKGHTRSGAITREQRRWRQELIAAMAKQGFVNYSKEWWHFSLPGAGGVAYDFPINARR